MKLFRWLAVSFSLYSRIPMPRFAWEEDDMRHSLLFFPVVGAVIGATTYLINLIPAVESLPLFVRSILTLLIPLLLTGGFHLDGFMDTTDALKSYGSREEKLRILKDPHIGAFAVIGLITCFLILCGSCGLIFVYGSRVDWLAGAFVFPLSRAMSGILAILLPKAKPVGMLVKETEKAGGGIVAALVVQLLAAAAGMIAASPGAGAAVALGMALFVLFYRNMTKKQFGGVTGDTAGFFVTVGECIAFLILAVLAVAV